MVLSPAPLAALLVAALGAPALLTDPLTGAQLPEVVQSGDTRFRCLGVGSRKTFVFKVYAVWYCVEDSVAEAALAGARQRHAAKSGDALADALRRDERFFEELESAPGDKLIVLRFARDIDSGRLMNALASSVKGLLSPRDAERFMEAAACPEGVKSGQTAYLRARGDDFVFELGPQRRVIAGAGSINERVWRVWTGAKGSTPSLRESIARQAARGLADPHPYMRRAGVPPEARRAAPRETLAK